VMQNPLSSSWMASHQFVNDICAKTFNYTWFHIHTYIYYPFYTFSRHYLHYYSNLKKVNGCEPRICYLSI
jgi:hypothetical protein